MPTKQGVTFQAIMQDLKNRNFAPFYLLMGEESYYIDTISDYIASHVLLPEECDFNQTICFGSDVTAVQVTDMAKRYPMMAEFQVIIVKEAQNIRSLEALEGYLKKPVKSTILVWCHKNGKIDTRKKVIGLAQAMGVVFESKKLRDYQLPEFIQNYLKSKKATIDPKSCQMIANHIGSDLSRIVSELDKILIYLPNDNRRVTPDIVEKEIGVSKDFNAFELRNAIVSKDIFKANQIIKYFDNNPKAGSLYALLPILFNYFQNLMLTYYAPDRNNQQDLANYLELRNVWSVKDYTAGARNYNGKKVLHILGKIREADAKSKGLDNPNTSPGDLMKELIFFILH